MKTQHAVVLPYPTQGHISPMMQFSEVLAAKGFTITFVNSEFNHKKLLQAYSLMARQPFQERGLDIRLVSIPDGLPPGHSRTSDITELSRCTETAMKVEFEKLMEKLATQEPPVTCIIADGIMSWTNEVNKKLGLPRLYFWTARTATFVIYYHIPWLRAKGCFPLTNNKPDELLNIPGVHPLRSSDLPSFLQDPTDFMHDWILRKIKPLYETDWVFVNSFYELDQGEFDVMSKTNTVMFPVGPLLPSSFLDNKVPLGSRKNTSLFEEDDECLRWLDEQRTGSVLYVSFGSVAFLSMDQVEELALGLEASEVPFLWVFRPEFVDGKTADPPEGFIERTKNRGQITKWAPQLDVLAHPAVGGFLTHCGWNSTLETVCLGVPTLGWPFFAEQEMNCRWMVEVLKIGMDFQSGDDGLVRKEEVRKKITTLMNGEEGVGMRRRASELKRKAQNAIHHGRSHHNIEAFVEYMNKRENVPRPPTTPSQF